MANGFDEPLSAVLNSAPELTQSPGLSVTTATAGGDIVGNAQSIAHAANTVTDQSAHSSVAATVGGPSELTNALNWFGNHVLAPVSHAASVGISDTMKDIAPVTNVLNKPLQLIQHEYRYLHDVEAIHGPTAAMLEGLGIAAGTVAGAYGGGFNGAELGAETAAGIEGQVFYHDSWERTGQASYADPHTKQQVSIGRDITSELSRVIPGLGEGTKGFKITSGLIDGIFDLQVGGPEVLGILGKANSAVGAAGKLGDYFPGKGPQTTEAFDNLMNSFSGGNVRRAFRDIASKNAGEIAGAYKSIAQQNDLLTALGHADTEEEVANIFRDIIRTHEVVYFDKLPTLSITRMPFQVAHEMMGDSVVPGIQALYRATTRLPESFDDVAGKWQSHEFNPAATDDGTLFVLRTALYTENRRTAAMIADEYANAAVPDKIKIWRNLVWNTLANMAGFRGAEIDEVLRETIQDPSARAMWKEAINKFIDTGMFGKEASYANDIAGDDISRVKDTETGRTYSAGITRNQQGNLSGLDLVQARRAAATLAQHRNFFGKLDDFAFDHITAPVFKRWVLMSPSYALHIALAELIPNSLRLGMFKVARSKLMLHMANTGIKVADGEERALAGVVWRMFQGIRRVVPGMANPTERDLGYMTDYILGNEMHLVPTEVASGHNLGDEIKPRQEAAVDLIRGAYFKSGAKKLGDDFGTFGSGETEFHRAWQARLHESANDEAAQLAAKRLLEYYNSRSTMDLAEIGPTTDRAMQRIYDEVAQNLREHNDGFMLRGQPNFTTFFEGNRPPDMDQFDEWARAMVMKVRGETTGVDGMIHKNLLEHVANGETVDEQTLHDIPPKSKPRNISGRRPVPNGDPKLQRVANWGFHHVLNPMVDFLSREPITAAEYLKQRNILQKWVDQGVMTDEGAHVQANVWASQNVIKNVHNLTDRTQWTATFRNWAPFYFAQEQAYRRMGRLLAEDPRAFRQYQLIIASMHNVGQVFQGPGGNGYFVFPGTGWMTSGVVKTLAFMGVPVESSAPIGMGWNLSSSSVIFPLSAGFRPDIGPILSVPTSAVAQFFPTSFSPILKSDLTSAADTILGPTANEALWMQMVPNSIIQRLVTAAIPAWNSRAFNASFMQTLATLDYEGKLPPPTADPRTLQTFLDRVRLQTQIMYAVKGLLGAVTPVSPEITNPIFNQFTSEVTADIKAAGSVAGGLQMFLSKNPDATPFTVWQSSNLTGASIPTSVQAEHWINENMDLISRYPNAAILLMPMEGMSTNYNPAAYNEQIAQGLRSKVDPEQWTQNGQVPSYIDSLYVAAGNAIFFKWLAQYEQQIAGLGGTEKYQAEQNFWGNGSVGPIPSPTGTVGRFGAMNPIWYRWFTDQTREVQRGDAIRQMTQLLKDNPNLHSPMADDTRALLEGYDNYKNQVTTLTNEGASSAQKTDAENNWKQYLYSVVNEHPELTNVVTGLFMSVQPKAAVSGQTAGQPGIFNATSWRQTP